MFSNFWPVLVYEIPNGCGWISVGSSSMGLNSRILSILISVNEQTASELYE